MNTDENSRLTHDTTRWLLNGERGMSSDAMVRAISPAAVEFRSHARPRDHPHDLDDFRRCEVALREIDGLRDYLPRMSEVSPTWAKLVEHWDEIVRLVESADPGFFRRRWEMENRRAGSVGGARTLLRQCIGRDA